MHPNFLYQFFSCTQSTDRIQLAKFSRQILKENIPARQYITEFSDWEKAFRAILDLPYGEEKKLIVIDEFPYMCRGNKSIPSILQNLWDAELRDSNVMIILCGIPHYLNQWNAELSVGENIKRNILMKGCVLYSEVDFLLHQELRETPLYNSIIEAVALGNTKLNDISQKSLIEDTSKTSVYLKNLIELGIIEREFSVDAGTKEKANSRGKISLYIVL